jgi:hypothetical protein
MGWGRWAIGQGLSAAREEGRKWDRRNRGGDGSRSAEVAVARDAANRYCAAYKAFFDSLDAGTHPDPQGGYARLYAHAVEVDDTCRRIFGSTGLDGFSAVGELLERASEESALASP